MFSTWKLTQNFGFWESFPEPEITGAEIVAAVLRRQVFLNGQ
jgi:hypothetical protein